MDERLSRLESRIAELTASLASVEARLAALEERRASGPVAAGLVAASPAPAPAAVPGPAEEADDASVFSGLLPLLGRSFLVLGGAYLIRAVTDAGTLPRPVGVGLGLAYAAALALAAGFRGSAMSAAFNGFLALLVGLPLVWEATTRLSVLSPSLSAVLVGALTAGVVAAAWRRDLQTLAWGAAVAGPAAALGLFLATQRAEPYTALLLVLGGASLWLTYGRRWHSVRWPAALAADAAVLIATTLAARSGGPPEAWASLSPAWVAALALGLFVVYPGSFASRTLVRQRSVNVFEVVQTVLALLIGFGGALRVADAAGIGQRPLGFSALLLAGAAYGVAFAFVERQAEARGNFLFFTSLALVLALSGAAVVGSGLLLPALWGGLGVVAAALGARFGRVSLAAHGAIYLWAAAAASGLLGASVDALARTPPWRELGASSLALLAASVVAFLLVARASWGERHAGTRLPSFFLALLSVTGVGGVAVTAGSALLPADPGTLAALRTFVLAAGAVGLAAVRSRTSLVELAWISAPLLGAGALKLLVEDLRVGRPATLFPAFVIYGAALLLAPRLLRGPSPRAAAPRGAA